MTTFEDLELIAPLQRAIAAQNYERPTPIQVQAIPPLLRGQDVVGCAQTGTGKTAAFALPVLQHLADAPPSRGRPHIRVLVLTPTRELAAQIGESFATYGRFLKSKHLVIFGGVNENPQISALKRGVDILVATPGRLLDLHGRGYIELGDVDFFVLDEADRMLDMGFVHDVRRVITALPHQRQNLLFSATMPPAITELARFFLKDPVHVEVTPQATTVERIDQTVMFVDRADKRRLLVDILRKQDVDRTIVFTRTKHGANRLAKQLDRDGIVAAAIHGNKSQNARKKALEGFRSGEVSVLIATDIASRGIDIDDVSHVVNYDLPNEPESYVHRIGRTGRAGRAGVAVSFCDTTEGEYLRDIEKTIGQAIPVVEDHPYHLAAAIPPPGRSGSGGGGGGGRSRAGRSRSKPNGSSGRRRPGASRARGGNASRDAAMADGPRRPRNVQAEAQRKARGEEPKKPAPKPRRRSDGDGASAGSPTRRDGDAPPRRRRRRRPPRIAGGE